jgi:hypothetical protein
LLGKYEDLFLWGLTLFVCTLNYGASTLGSEVLWEFGSLMRAVFVAMIVLLNGVQFGCASVSYYTQKFPTNPEDMVPPLHLDVQASEVDLKVTSMGGGQPDWADPQALRQDLAEALNALMLPVAVSVPAGRFSIKGKTWVDKTYPGTIPCFGYLTLWGCPIALATARVVVTLEFAGQRIRATGRGSAYSFLYGRDPASMGQRPALARALRSATRGIARRMRKAQRSGSRP